jgi:hypothetical protein
MVHVPSLLLGLSVAGSTTAYSPYGYDRPAKVSLFDSSDGCAAERPSTDVSLGVNTCLWGDFPLVNFKVKRTLKCFNGAEPVAYIYPTTTCTGNPSFRSDKQVLDQEHPDLWDTCLFFGAPTEWSMIFRCDRLESQAIASGNYLQAIPPNYDSMKSPISAKASDGVVTPYTSFDCTIYKPHEPTYLPADTCLNFSGTEGRSVFIHKPAICANGSAALVESFPEPGCQKSDESDVSVSEDGLSLDKKCVGSWDPHVRSMRFRCDDKEMEKFEDLPPHQHAEVEPLIIQEAPSPAGVIHKAQGGKIKTYSLADCETDQRPERTSVKAVDTCVWTFMYKSMEVKDPAICANGTQALFATYSRPGCKPEDLKYLGDLPEQVDDTWRYLED